MQHDHALHLRLSSDTRRQIERQAALKGVSLSEIVRRAIQAGLESVEEKNDDNE